MKMARLVSVLPIFLSLSISAVAPHSEMDDGTMRTCAVSNGAASACGAFSSNLTVTTSPTTATNMFMPTKTPPESVVVTLGCNRMAFNRCWVAQEPSSEQKPCAWSSWIGPVISALVALVGAFGAAWFAYHLSNRRDSAIRRSVASKILLSLSEEMKSNEQVINGLPGNIPSLNTQNICLSTKMWETYENHLNEGVLFEIFRAIGNDNGTGSSFPLSEFLTHTTRYFRNICPRVNAWIVESVHPSPSEIQQIQEASCKVRATLEQIERKMK